MLETLPTLTAEEMRPLPGPHHLEEGFGALTTARGALPLIALEARARLDGLIASIEVEQTFVNSHNEPLEATYVFPLPDRAAVTRCQLQVAGRTHRG